MASSLYQNAGPGRPPPPPGTYRQNQPPIPPPGHYGAPNHYNYGPGPPPPGPPHAPPPYAAAGPPRAMAYNPSYAYGSAVPSPPPYGPPGVPGQGQYPPSLPPYSLQSHPPPPMPPAPPSQPPHRGYSFSTAQNSTSQPHQSAHPPPYYPPSLPPLPSQPPPPPPPPAPTSHPSASQQSSHTSFSSSLIKQQPLPPPPPPVQDALPSSGTSTSIGNVSAGQPHVGAVRQTTGQGNHAQSQNNWISSRDANNASVAQGNWSSGREGSTAGSTQGAWKSAPTQGIPHPAPLQGLGSSQGGAASSQGMATGVLPAEFATPAKAAKTAGALESSVPGSVLRVDGRFETEEQRRERKKRDYERKKLEENKRDKESQAMSTVHKIHPMGTPLVKYTTIVGSRDGRVDRKIGSSIDKVENRLKRPSTFLCKIKFRNELPDPVSQPKLLRVHNDKDQYTKYTITSLEKTQKHKLFVDPDLGIPLDLLDITVYNAPKVKPPMDPEDEELLRDDEKIPLPKNDNIRKKDRPTDKGVAWLVKTQYISPVSLDPAKQSLTEKQAKELKEQREGKRDFLDVLNDREQQIESIEESFRVAKQRPVHQTKPGLEPVEVIPLLPDFERWGDQLVHMVFDGEPTADSELHSKLDRAVRDELEERAIMKSYVLSGTESLKSEKFLAYMVPKVEEVVRDICDDDDDMPYTWVREYHWDVRAEDAQNTITYVFSFGEDSVHYLPLGTKLTLQKKKAKEGRSKDEVESQYPIPSSVTVHRQEMTQEEEEEREAQRRALIEGFGTSARDTSTKRRHSSEAEMPPSKRTMANSRDISDEEDEVSV